MLKKIGLFVMLSASLLAMHNAEVNINDKDLELGLQLDIGQFNRSVDPSTVFLGFKYLHADYDHGDIGSEEAMNDFAEINFLMTGRVGNSGLSIGMGMKMNHTEEFMTFPLGIELKYRIPNTSSLPMKIGFELYYAPEVLSKRHAESFLEYRFEYDIEVIKRGHIVFGYRNLDTNYIGMRENFNYNHSLYGGFRFLF